MRIGIVTVWFERGAAYVSRQYLRALEPQHEVFIYARGGEERAVGDPAWDGPRVTWAAPGMVPIAGSMDPDHFRQWIADNRLEVVFFNEQHWWEPVILCHELGVKIGVYIDYYTEQTIPLFGCYDFLICNTRRHYSAFEWHPQCFHVPWGTDTDHFKPRSLEAVQAGTVTFFHSAGMNPIRKGTDLAIKSFAALGGQARLIVHTQYSLACLSGVQATIAELERTGRLTIHQGTVQSPGLYHLGDVYVYPTRLDGVGLTVAEALSCGLPVIASDIPPMDEFVAPESGRLVQIIRQYARADGYYWPQCLASTLDLTAQMRFYLEHSECLAAFKQAARQHAEANLNWSKNAEPLAEIFSRTRLLPASEKASALRMARAFELRRAEANTRFWFSYHYPRVFKTCRSVARGWRQVLGKRNASGRNACGA